MLQIGNTIISDDLAEKKFCCDLEKCKGACCIYGDSGAPLEDHEVDILMKIYPKITRYLRPEGIQTIEEDGTYVIDSDGDKVTPLIKGKECAYVYFDADIAKCAIEKAYNERVINFKKPVSCHLFPVRLTHYDDFTAVNYCPVDICKPAINKGERNNIKVDDFLEEPLTRRFGKSWFKELKLLQK
jgi:hypothetical protein